MAQPQRGELRKLSPKDKNASFHRIDYLLVCGPVYDEIEAARIAENQNRVNKPPVNLKDYATHILYNWALANFSQREAKNFGRDLESKIMRDWVMPDYSGDEQ